MIFFLLSVGLRGRRASRRKRDVATSAGTLAFFSELNLLTEDQHTGAGSHVALTPRRSPVALTRQLIAKKTTKITPWANCRQAGRTVTSYWAPDPSRLQYTSHL